MTTCANHSHRATRYKVGSAWHTAEHCERAACDGSDLCPCRCAGCLGAERAGCPNEAVPEADVVLDGRRILSALGFCAACWERYRARKGAQVGSGGAGGAEVARATHSARVEKVARALPPLCGHGLRRGGCGACVGW